MTVLSTVATPSARRVAVYIDFENIKRAVDAHFVNERVDLKRILDGIVRATEGRIVLKRAYADWGAYKDYRSDLLDSATEAVQSFALTHRGKNSTDIRIAIDVMEFVLRQSDTTDVVLVSGDSDFTPLVMKLREFGCIVVGIGVRSHTSNYLARACDQFIYYDDLLDGNGNLIDPGAADSSRLLATALNALGNRPIPGSALKLRMRQLDPLFNEERYGHPTFLDFLRAHTDLVEIYKPAVGDITVSPRVQSDSPQASQSARRSDRYRQALREENFRYVPSAERREIIRVLFRIFAEADSQEGISLKEAKDRLHAWFEENQPSVPWESVNSTVYHLFYTWCFTFDRSDEADERPLWDRRTEILPEVLTEEGLIERCDRGILRRLLDRERSDLDPEAVNAWLCDGNEEALPYVTELIRTVVAAPVAAGTRGN